MKILLRKVSALIFLGLLTGCGMLKGGVEEILSSTTDLNFLKVSGDLVSVDVNEGTSLVIFYSLSKARSSATVVDLTISSSRNDQGTVFSSPPATFTIPAGSKTGVLSLSPTYNPIYTGDLDFGLSIGTTATDVVISNSSLTLNVKDLESIPVLAFSSGANNVNENSGSGTVTVNMSPASAYAVTVAYSFSAGTATVTSDYTASSGSLTFAPGDTSKTIPFTIVDDISLESTENFTVSLGAVTGQATISGTLNSKTTNIVDDDTTTLSIDDITVDEGNNLVFTVTLSQAVGSNVTVDYATANGTALAGTHYTAASNTLTFTPGQTTKTISVPSTAIPAEICHADRNFTVTLSNPINASLGISTGTGTIRDPDLPSLSVAAGSTAEGGSVTLVASLSQVCATKTVTFTWGTSAVTATAGTDYVSATGSTGSITAGNTSTNLTVLTNDDTAYEGDETFTVTMSAPTNATLGTAAATGTIQENETAPTVQWTASSSSANESAGSMTITAQLSAAAAVNVSVPFTVTGTATVASDYSITASPLTITAGATTATATITLVNDAVVESDETVILTMGSPTNASAGATTVHTATILNDDIADFTISGIQSATLDTTSDAYLNFEANPKIIFASASGATSYDVTVYENDGTTVKCALQNTASTSFSPSACTLTAGTSYKAKVTGKNASSITKDATNSLYTFTYNRTPVATGDTVMVMYDGSAVTYDPRSNDTDADGDTLTISAVGSPTYGTLTTDGSSLTYTPAGTGYGTITVNYTISDSKGATSTASQTIKLMTTYTWTGASASAKNWNDADNWCGTVSSPGLSGSCSGGVGFPTDKTNASHFAVFNSTVCSAGPCASALINAATQAYSIYMMTSNVVNISQVAGVGNTLDIGAGGLTMRGGNFTGGNANITISGANTDALIAYSVGTLTATSATMTVACSGASGTTCWSAEGGTFTHNSGTVVIQGDSTGNKTYNLNWATTAVANDRPKFYNVKLQSINGTASEFTSFNVVNTGNVYTIGSAYNLEIGSAAGSSGRVELNGTTGNLYLSGSAPRSVTATNGAAGGSATLYLEGAGGSTVSFSSTGDGILPVIYVAGAVSTVTADIKANGLRIGTSASNVFNFPSGIFSMVATRAKSSLNVRIDSPYYFHNNGVFKIAVDSAATGSVSLSATSTVSGSGVDGSFYLNDFVFECAGDTTANTCSGTWSDSNADSTDKMVVTGDMAVSQNAGERTVNQLPHMDLRGDLSLDRVTLVAQATTGRSLTMNGTLDQTITSLNSSHSGWATISVDKPTSTLNLSGDLIIDWWDAGFNILAGTVHANGYNLTSHYSGAGHAGTVNISAGATLDMDGGTLIHEGLTNSGTYIP